MNQMNLDSALEESFSSCFHSLFIRAMDFGILAGLMERCGSAAFVRTLLKATAESALTGLFFPLEVSPG
jgi:hypothetical protein